MFEAILTAIWFFLPAGLANTAPVIAMKIPFLKKFNAPLDFGIEIGGARLFGKNKSIRGLIAGIIVGIVVVLLQQNIYMQSDYLKESINLDYSLINPLILGSLFALGALLGDAIESSFKRRIGVAPGKAWFPFDQLDYIIGGVAFTLLYVQLNLLEYVLIFLIWFTLHPISTVIGYFLKLKESPI